jgi:hypothetical protein
MNKTIISLLLIFSNSIMCMKQQLSITPAPDLPMEIMDLCCTDLYKSYDTPEKFHYGTIKMCLINKAFYSYTNNPITIRTIFNNAHIEPVYTRGTLVRLINIDDFAKSYIKQSEKLFDTIHTIDNDGIRHLVNTGADVNYADGLLRGVYDKCVIFKTQHNYEKTKLLLKLGADINTTSGTETPLKQAIRNQDIDMIKLLITYKPMVPCLKEAIKTKNPTILELILESMTLKKIVEYAALHPEELKKRLEIIIEEVMKELDKAEKNELENKEIIKRLNTLLTNLLTNS